VTLTETSPDLLSALAEATGLPCSVHHTGGGCMVASVSLRDGAEVWLTRDEGWVCGFYDFAADPEDDGLCVSLLEHDTGVGSSNDDPAWVAGQVAGIIRRVQGQA
jgi:hypothetical protein